MILVDSSFIIAIYVENDQWHDRAKEIAEEIYKKEKITTDLIISETITLVANKTGAKESKELYYHILDNYNIFEADRNIYNKSINTLLKYNGTLSLADSLSIELMKELKINEIASFDSDFDNKEGIIRIH